MDDQPLEQALSYLDEHSGRFSPETLRMRLLDIGYDPATVDRAIQVLQGNDPAPPRTGTGRTILLVMAINLVLAVVILVGTANLPGDYRDLLSFLGAGLVLLVCGEFFLGLALCFSAETRAEGLGLLFGSLLSIILGPLLLLGACLGLFGGHSAMLLFFQGW